MKEKETLQKKLLYFAKKHLGKPYKYGAKPWEAPKTFDCSSFIQYLYERISIHLPRIALEQARLGRKVDSKKEELEIGDLLFFKGSVGRYNPQFLQGIGHAAIYVGNRKVIHAKYKKNKDGSDDGKVIEQSFEVLLKRKDLIVIKRII